MATLAKLLSDGTLVEIAVPMDGNQVERWIYGPPEFADWLANILPNLKPGRLKAADPPDEQVDDLMFRWRSGKPILYQRQFKDLMPMKDEVWEFKTADVRIFGWMCEPLKFVAVFGDYADLYKGNNARKSYEDAKQKVSAFRNKLPLDEPKIASGFFDDLVSI